MGRSNMSSLKVTLSLAIFFLAFLSSQIAAKPSPKHLLIETEGESKDNGLDYSLLGRSHDYENGNNDYEKGNNDYEKGNNDYEKGNNDYGKGDEDCKRKILFAFDVF